MPTICVDCPNCGDDNSDFEVEVEITHGGSRGSYGLPEYSFPGEGAEWHTKEPATCDVCKTTFTEDALNEYEKLNEKVQEYANEPDEPDWDYDDEA